MDSINWQCLIEIVISKLFLLFLFNCSQVYKYCSMPNTEASVLINVKEVVTYKILLINALGLMA